MSDEIRKVIASALQWAGYEGQRIRFSDEYADAMTEAAIEALHDAGYGIALEWSENMDTRELTFKGEDKTVLYACGKCGRIASPGIYLANEKKRHAAARRAAEECCQPYHCSDCSVETERYYTRCRTCHTRKQLQKATQIKPDHHTGPVCSDANSGGWGDGYSSSIEDLLDVCRDEGQEPPAYVFACEAHPLAIDIENLFVNLTEDRHESVADSIVDAEELEEFIKAWNAKQTAIDYMEDRSTVIVLDRERFEALIAPAKESTDER